MQDFLSCASHMEEVKSQLSGFDDIIPSLSSNAIKNQGLSQFDDALNNLIEEDEDEDQEEEEQEVNAPPSPQEKLDPHSVQNSYKKTAEAEETPLKKN